MPVVFDAKVLVALLDPPDNVDPVLRSRVEYLVQELGKKGDRVLIPAPALAEVLVRASNVSAYLDEIERTKNFTIAPFDKRAAVEIAAAHREALEYGDKKEGTSAPWQKVKYDRQIVAIARANGASMIYTGDGDVITFAERDQVEATHLDDLPDSPEPPQASLDL